MRHSPLRNHSLHEHVRRHAGTRRVRKPATFMVNRQGPIQGPFKQKGRVLSACPTHLRRLTYVVQFCDSQMTQKSQFESHQGARRAAIELMLDPLTNPIATQAAIGSVKSIMHSKNTVYVICLARVLLREAAHIPPAPTNSQGTYYYDQYTLSRKAVSFWLLGHTRNCYPHCFCNMLNSPTLADAQDTLFQAGSYAACLAADVDLDEALPGPFNGV